MNGQRPVFLSRATWDRVHSLLDNFQCLSAVSLSKLPVTFLSLAMLENPSLHLLSPTPGLPWSPQLFRRVSPCSLGKC